VKESKVIGWLVRHKDRAAILFGVIAFFFMLWFEHQQRPTKPTNFGIQLVIAAVSGLGNGGCIYLGLRIRAKRN
jgi:hypothetical protein